MNNIDLTHLGGFPLEQDTLDFMQLDYKSAFGAIAKLCGNKTILFGVEIIAGNVTPGWIAVDGELILFQGGVYGGYVVIATVPTQVTYEDGLLKEAYYVKTATCGGIAGDFPFADLQPLLTLQNTWLPGDLKQKYVDAAYEAANFDGAGYGINKEKGWRLLSSAVPDAAGKVLVNKDAADSDFDTVGNFGGEKNHTLTIPEMPSHSHGVKWFPKAGGDGNNVLGHQATTNGPNETMIQPTGGGNAHNNMQPYFVVITLIKL
jgi:hypothetical protein